MVNHLLEIVTNHGLNQVLYNVFFALGFVAVFTFNLLNCKNFDIPKWKSVVLTIAVYTLSVLWMFFLYWVAHGFKDWGGNNIVRIFIWVPVFTWPVCKLLKLDFLKCCEFIAPCLCVVHGVAHLGCIFAGCCHGYAWDYGIMNHALGYKTFPIQPIEAITALLIVVFIWGRQKRMNFKLDGLSYPLMLMLFGYSRFLYEFARDNEKMFLGISGLAIHALIAGLVGSIWYITVKDINRRKLSGKGRRART